MHDLRKLSGGLASIGNDEMKKSASVPALWAIATLMLAWLAASPRTEARNIDEFLVTLGPEERQVFDSYYSATRAHEHRADVYWNDVSTKRTERRRKRTANLPVMAVDYVKTFPPTYDGPRLTPDLAKRWAAFQEKEAEKRPPPKPKPGLADFLAHAQAQYNFSPERITEHEFKVRYAREALAAGLTKDQVVRIYALETSGLGTADMIAGIHPIKKTGTPISTAMGYAQLLAANTINELAKSGPNFIERLQRLAAAQPQRAAIINAKIAALQQMIAVSRSVPEVWSKQVSLAATPRGLGIHAINIDGDIGPWLQVIKIKGLKTTAERKGVTRLTGAEIELMNLAGPGTGLEMMTPVARPMPTPNFFERGAYGRNTIVRGKTAEQLIAALDERMEENIKNAGAVEFLQVFDALMAGAPGGVRPPAPAPAPAPAYAPPPPPPPAAAAPAPQRPVNDAYVPPKPGGNDAYIPPKRY